MNSTITDERLKEILGGCDNAAANRILLAADETGFQRLPCCQKLGQGRCDKPMRWN